MAEQTAERESLIAYKAFDENWSCRGFVYEVGKTYEHKGDVALCDRGFHAVTVPFDAWDYYHGSHSLGRVRLDDVRAHARDDSKCVAVKLTFEAKLSLSEWAKAQAEAVLALCRGATGALVSEDEDCAAATGDRGHAVATGDSGHAAATGKHAVAASLGYAATAEAGPDGWIVLARWSDNFELIEVKTAKVGTEGVEAGKCYRLTAKGFEEAA